METWRQRHTPPQVSFCQNSWKMAPDFLWTCDFKPDIHEQQEDPVRKRCPWAFSWLFFDSRDS